MLSPYGTPTHITIRINWRWCSVARPGTSAIAGTIPAASPECSASWSGSLWPYRVAHTPVGDPWTPWLTFAQRTTRGSHAWKYIPISTSHDAYKLSFLPRTIIAWNQLPSIIIDAPSLDAFRSRLVTSQP